MSLIALLIGFYVVYPSLLSPLQSIPEPRFASGHLAAVALARYQLSHAHFSSFLDLLGYPGGADFRPLLWPMVLLGAIVGPALSINLTFFLIPLGNALSGWALGQKLGFSPLQKTVLGVLVAGHPWVLETLINGQLEQAWVGGIGLVWWWLPWDGQTTLRKVLAGGATAVLVGLAAPHVLLAGLVGAGWIGLASGAWRAWAMTLGSMAVGAGLVNLWYAPSLTSTTSVFAPKGSVLAAPGVAELPDEATLSGLLWPMTLVRPEPVIHPNYLSLVLLSGAAISVIQTWKKPGLEKASPVTKALAISALAMAILSMGVGPYALLQQIGSVGASASPYRLLMGAVWALAVLAASGVQDWKMGVLIGGLFLGESLGTLTRPLPLPAIPPGFDAVASQLKGKAGPVLDLPYPWNHCESAGLHYAINATAHHRPIPYLISYGKKSLGPSAEWFDRLQSIWPMQDCPAQFSALIKEAGFTAVVSHEHGPDCTLEKPRLACVTKALGPKMLYREVRVWELGAPDPERQGE